MKFQLESALAVDTLHADQIVVLHNIEKSIPSQETNNKYLINSLIDSFRTTFQAIPPNGSVSLPDATSYPYFYEALKHWDIIKIDKTKKLSRHDNITLYTEIRQNEILFLDMLVERSFGHYLRIFEWILITFLIGRCNKPLHIFLGDPRLSTIPNLPEIIYWVPNLHLHTLTDSKIKVSLLKAYCDSGFGSNMAKEALTSLYQKTGIESEFCYSKETISLFEKKSEDDIILSKAQQVLKKKLLANKKLNNSILNFFTSSETNQKKIGVINRDSLYVGEGQSWRDSEISKFNKAINSCINNKYAIVRLNKVGMPVEIEHNQIIDFTMHEVSFIDQLYGMSNIDYFIGTSTGASDYPTRLFGIPSLLLDSAVVYECGFSGQIVHAPKRIFVSNTKQLKESNLKELINFFFRGQWSLDQCNKYGLGIRPLNEDEIDEIIIRFLSRKGSYSLYKTSYGLTSSYGEFPDISNTFLDDITYKDIKDILIRYAV